MMQIASKLWPVTLALLSVSMFGCGDDPVTPSPNLPGAGTVTVTIEPGASTLTETAFGDNPLVIQQGTTVTWVNGDTVDHTVSSSEGVWDSGLIPPGGSFSRRFDEEGQFSYFSQLHPNMSGTIVVEGDGASPSPSPSPSPSASPTSTPSPIPTASPSPSPTMSAVSIPAVSR